MAYLLIVELIVLPLVVFELVRPIAPHLAVGMMLIAALPPAGIAPVFCDLVNGNTALCVGLYILSYLVAPLTLTFVMAITGQASLDLLGLFSSITMLIFIPILLALAAKKWLPGLLQRTRHHFGAINLVIVVYLIFGVVANQAAYFRQHIAHMAVVTLLMYAYFAVLHIIGYYLLPRRPEADRLAISVSTAYMNTALGVVLAIAFFSREVVLVAIAAEVPWCTMLGPARWAYRRFRTP